jgi:hypothetical protein
MMYLFNLKKGLIALLIFPLFCNAQLVTNGLIAYYPFNGNANDASSNGNNGIVYDAILTSDRFGNTSSAYSFDGIDDYIEIVDNASLNPANVSIVAWVKADYAPSGTPDIVRKGSFDSDANHEYLLRLTNNSNPDFKIRNNGLCSPYSSWQSNTSSANITLNQWQFLVGTFDGTVLNLYINGTLNQTVTITTGNINNGCTSGPLKIGNAWATYPNWFKGVIDDVRIYNRALNACEVLTLYNESGSNNDNGLIAYYPFNGNANDVSINSNNGTVYDATLTSDRFGNASSAYSFDGIDDYIEVADNTSLNPANVSIAAWVKADYAPSGTPDIVRKGSFDSGANHEYLLRLTNNSNPDFKIRNNGLCATYSSWQSNTSSANITLNQWQFLVGTFDGTVLNLYINGTLNQTVTVTTGNINNSCTSGPLKIGNAWATYPNWFKGKIDDVRIYDRALDACEVNYLYSFEGTVFSDNNISTGVSSMSITKPNVQIYPNPFSENITLSGLNNDNGAFIEILDNQGRSIISQLYNNTPILTNKLSNGIYLLKVTDNSGNELYSTKIVRY